jgi:hypothetical protein
MLQDLDEPDAALIKLRIAASSAPWSSRVWSNVGVGFMQKKKLVAVCSKAVVACTNAPNAHD